MAASQGGETRALSPGETAVDALRTSIVYQVTLPRGSFVSISSDSPSTAIRFVLRDPRGGILRDIPCWYEGQHRIVETAPSSGTYTLTIQACADLNIEPFHIALRSTPAVTDHDRFLINAARLEFEADLLLADYKQTSRSKGILKYREAL